MFNESPEPSGGDAKKRCLLDVEASFSRSETEPFFFLRNIDSGSFKDPNLAIKNGWVWWKLWNIKKIEAGGELLKQYPWTKNNMVTWKMGVSPIGSLTWKNSPWLSTKLWWWEKKVNRCNAPNYHQTDFTKSHGESKDAPCSPHDATKS